MALSGWIAALGVLFLAGAATALEPCQSDCAVLGVGSGSARPNQSVSVSVSFQQGPADGEQGSGNDDTAAIAFTLGIPGTGAESSPLTLPCVNSGDGSPNKLASDAVTIGDAIADDFRVVVENAECVSRDHCLCPSAGQRRDDFVNVVVYGPKELPDQGPVPIPVLPENTELMTFHFRVPTGTTPQTVALHVFAETDDGSPAKPQNAAFASIGDQSGVDQTANRDADLSQITINDGQVEVAASLCVGDCGGNAVVSINELVLGVNIALGLSPTGSCPNFDEDDSGSVEIDELISGVNNALNGCS